MHKTPARQEIEACHRWLEAELRVVDPVLVVCLGATAARALVGRTVKIGEMRGNIHERDTAQAWLFTVHPSYVLRVPAGSRAKAYDALVSDLKVAAGYAAARAGSGRSEAAARSCG